MKAYRSTKEMDFENSLCCALDDVSSEVQFISLFNYMKEIFPSALKEWKDKRKYSELYGFRDAYEVAASLKEIGILR